MKKSLLMLPVLLLVALIFRQLQLRFVDSQPTSSQLETGGNQMDVDGLAGPDLGALSKSSNPLQIEFMRQQTYPGSQITEVDNLPNGSNYTRQIVSYESEGNTIYALMATPMSTPPEAGWPVIIFNHGYIPPAEYRTTEKYVAYLDYFARNGYLVFKSDYRGHGNSEGEASSGYGSPGYTIDVLNAVASLKNHSVVDETRIGMWGHSMGGYITVRTMVITKDIKAGVIWGGVVASYQDLLESWRRRNTTPPPMPSGARRWRDLLQETYGAPQDNPVFWNSISANTYLTDLSGPIQLHHAQGDAIVPWEFSQQLADQLQAANQPIDLYLYEGDDHNISGNFSLAMRRSLEFFDAQLKK